MSITTPSMQELLEAGVHFGHQVRRGHPRMAEFIFGAREGVHIINLEFSESKLKEAAEFAYNLGKEGKVLLFVGTKKQAQPIIAEEAVKVGAPYVDFRWVGGFLTNFDEIRKNIKQLLELKDKKAKGELSHYTKKEQLLISRRIEKFDVERGGMANLDRVPDAVFLVDCVNEKTALTESVSMEIPVIGIADTNCNPLLLDYPIPGNDDATKSIRIITEAIATAYKAGLVKGKGLRVKGEEEEKKAEEKKEKAVEKAAPEEATISDEVAAAEEEVEKKALAESERVV